MWFALGGFLTAVCLCVRGRSRRALCGRPGPRAWLCRKTPNIGPEYLTRWMCFLNREEALAAEYTDFPLT